MNKFSFTAIYGVFNNDMEPVDVKDVTDIVHYDFFSEGRIIIPAQINLDHVFHFNIRRKRNFLQIHQGSRKYNIAEDDYSNPIVIDLNNKEKQLRLIYFAYIHRESNWRDIVAGQLQQLKSYGLLDEVELYVHITDPAGIFTDVIETVVLISNDAIISVSNQNYYEYHAIKLAYDLAKDNPDRIYLYMHTKGMTYNVQERIIPDIALVKGTFKNWRRKPEYMMDTKINKMGLFPAVEDNENKMSYGAVGGWIWYNFWYAKGKYLIKCGEPLLTNHRWYYEDWLGGPQDDQAITKKDCYSLFYETNDDYFTGSEADKIMGYWQMFYNQEFGSIDF